jgi:hypothetical protein
MSDKSNKKKDLAKIIASRMAGTVQQIDELRSTRGQIKGALTKDTMYRLRQAVADHQKADEEGTEARLAVILGLCDTYIQRHGKEEDARAKEKLKTVDRIQEQAMSEMRDWGQRQAQGRYLQDAYALASAERDSPGFSATRMTEATQPAELARAQTKRLAAGKAGKEEGYNQATLDLIKKYGLTEAEVLAVKVYSASDYKYINPATANSESWMKTQNSPHKPAKPKAQSAVVAANLAEADNDSSEEHLEPPAILEDASQVDRELATILEGDDRELSTMLESDSEEDRQLWQLLQATSGDNASLPRAAGTTPEQYFETKDGRDHLKRLFEEGSLHGAVAIAALRKLPPMAGTCYRGERMTEAAFAEMYGDARNRKLPKKARPNLTSVATERQAAQKFANGTEETPRDATVSVVTEVTVKLARDIGDLSIFGRREKEWLLLPGTTLDTDSVEELPKGAYGNPTATRWVLVKAHEA